MEKAIRTKAYRLHQNLDRYLSSKRFWEFRIRDIYQGATEQGRRKFLRGESQTYNDSYFGKKRKMHFGWRKAQLAKEQGKKAL